MRRGAYHRRSTQRSSLLWFGAMAAPARLRLLGTPTLTHGGTTWVLPFERRSQLVVLLGLAGGWVGRRDAAAALWPVAGFETGGDTPSVQGSLP